MSELIEKVAKAICVSQGDDPDREGPFHKWVSESPYASMASAAIEAVFDHLAEPGETAVDEGGNWIAEKTDWPMPLSGARQVYSLILAQLRKEALG